MGGLVFFWRIAFLPGIAFLDHNQDDREMWVFENTPFEII